MKKLRLGLLLFIFVILYMIPSYSLEVPDETDTKLIQTINQEHKNTRQFFSTELARQRTEFFKQTDDRATYYEEELNKLLTTAVWKLSLLWAGIMFFFVSFNNLIRNNLEKKRFKKLKESIKSEILADINIQNQTPIQQRTTQPILKTKQGYDVEVDELFKTQPLQQPQIVLKKSFFEKRKEEKLRKQFLKNQKEQEELKRKLGLNIPQPQLQPNPQQPNPQPTHPQNNFKPEIHYDDSFEVEY